MEEIWKPIKGYEGLYEISNCGRVKRLETEFKDSLGRRVHRKEEIKNGIMNGAFYLHVKLFKDGVYSTVNIHRLVAEAFIPNPNNLPCVNHKDESRDNNHVDNLEWCSYGYNNTYGTACKRRNESIAFAKATGITKQNLHRREIERKKKPVRAVIQYSLDGKVVHKYAGGLQEAAAKYSINIGQCMGGRCKSSHGFVWRYEGTPFSYSKRRPVKHQRYVIELNGKGEELRRLDSIQKAADYYGVDTHVFSSQKNTFVGQGKLAGKIFVVETQKCHLKHNPRRGPNPNLKGRGCRPIIQYSKDGVFIAQYKSMTEAAENIHIPGNHVGNLCKCCLGEIKSAYGYVWKYAKEDKQ